MKKIFIILILSTISIFAFCQEVLNELKNYDWDENAQYIKLNESNDQLPEVIILTRSLSEYVFEEGKFVFYSVDHKILKVNTDDAINQNNTISIAMSSNAELMNLKVRTISRDGKITLSDKSNIKEIQNDENNRASRIFAVEGVEKGCEIEYFYVIKSNPDICHGLYLQSGAPILKAYFQLTTPDHLLFNFKGYNGFPSMSDTVIGSKRIYYTTVLNIPELRYEPYSNYTRSRMRLEYKLAVNLAKSKKELYTWSDYVQYKYNELNTLTKDEKKASEKLFKSLNLIDNMSVEKKVRCIENYIKTNILIQDIYNDDNTSLNKIIHNKYTNKEGIIKLYYTLFHIANIETQLVVTSNREKLPFDGSFESWRFINNSLFYIVSTNQFLTPEATNFRYPMIPSEFTYTDGLFFKEVNVGGMKSAIPVIHFISPLDSKLSGQDIDAEISLIKDMQETNLKLTCALRGYYGVYVQPYYNDMPNDKKQEMLSDLVKDLTIDKNYTSITAENTEPNLCLTEKPFIVHAEVNGSSLLEKAGNRFLLKVGEILGKQMELYQDNERQTDIECDYNHEYNRKIKVNIPDGYVIKNLDDINITHFYENNGEKVYCFVSGYSLENNTLTINIRECYNQIQCSIAYFEDYRKVINAAADFNKVVLILEPK